MDHIVANLGKLGHFGANLGKMDHIGAKLGKMGHFGANLVLVRVGAIQTVFNPFPRRHFEPSPSE